MKEKILVPLCIQIVLLKCGSMKLVTVKLPEALVEGINELVAVGLYPSRSAAIRSAVRDMLKKELWNSRRSSEARI